MSDRNKLQITKLVLQCCIQVLLTRGPPPLPNIWGTDQNNPLIDFPNYLHDGYH